MTTPDVASAKQCVASARLDFRVIRSRALHGIGSREGLMRCGRSGNGRGAAGRPFELVALPACARRGAVASHGCPRQRDPSRLAIKLA